jgi:hypothetical protein
MNVKLNAAKINALKLVEAGEVTFSYRSAPKIKGTRLVKAMSTEWLNKKIARGVTDAMLEKLFALELVTSSRGGHGWYTVKLTKLGAEALASATGPIVSLTVEAKDAATPVLEAAVEAISGEIFPKQWARKAIVDGLLAAAKSARTEVSRKALADAAQLVAMDEFDAARKMLTPLRTRQARAAIAAIKGL